MKNNSTAALNLEMHFAYKMLISTNILLINADELLTLLAKIFPVRSSSGRSRRSFFSSKAQKNKPKSSKTNQNKQNTPKQPFLYTLKQTKR